LKNDHSEKNILNRMISADSNRFLGLGVLALVLVLGGIVLGARYLINYFNGPYAISNAELVTITDPDKADRYWVTITGDAAADTGWELVRSRNGVETSAEHYAVLLIENSVLLMELPGRSTEVDPDVTQTGALVSIPSRVQNEVMPDLRQQSAEMVDAMLPFMLDTGNFRDGGNIGLVVAGLAGAFGFFMLFVGLLRKFSPTSHPIFKYLSKFGDPASLATQINSEGALPHHRAGKVHFLQNWLVSNEFNSINAVPYEDMVWAYQAVTQHRTNGIKTGKSYVCKMLDRTGKETSISGKEAQVEEMLKAVLARAPWAIVGYDEKLTNLWKKQRNDFIAAVDARKANMRQAQAAGSGQGGANMPLSSNEQPTL
jgi:hypothetical protein